MRYILFAFIIWAQPILAQNIKIDRREAKKAYQYLNEFRMNPKKYGREIRVNNLRNVKQTRLVWNDQLAKVAEERAKDMARRNYFDHTDPSGYGPNYHINKAGYYLNPDWLKKKTPIILNPSEPTTRPRLMASNPLSLAADRPVLCTGSMF